MPYFVFRIRPFAQIEKLAQFDGFQAASAHAKTLRAGAGEPSPGKIKVMFADNCAGCHQAGGAGLIGSYPSLVDDDWIWGGKFSQVEKTIRKGRTGSMPAFGARFDEDKINALSEYVLSLSGQSKDAAMVHRGKILFQGEAGCAACHTSTGQGNIAMGSANLTDQIWTVANIQSKSDHDKRLNAIKYVITNGIGRTMPAWESRFTDTEIKMLTLYVHELGSSK